MIRATLIYIILCGIIVFFFRCESSQLNPTENTTNNENTNDQVIEGSVVSASECKQFKTGDILSDLPDTVSCVEFSFNPDSNRLTLKHLNAGFNCCPESLFCSVSTNGDTLIIQEFEAAALCRCNCLYDLEIVIDGIEAKTYQLKFIEPYAMAMEQLVFEIDLSSENNGSYCVTRKTYPWGVFDGQEEPAEITGEIVHHTNCKSFSSEMQISKDITPNESCVEYTYDAETSSMSMKHINAAFNCCPEGIFCMISTSGDTIIVQEAEEDGLCDCLCLFDVDIEIEGLQPGSYFIKFNEPFLGKDPKLEFEIDLREFPSGLYCVTREEYPWGI